MADTRFWQRSRHYAILSRILWFLMADRKWLSTGEAAKLCSVTPDAVQKWIRSRRLAAQKTPGGHYRIALEDITPFATGAGLRRWFPAPPRQCTPQPLRCWEYLSNTEEVRDECKACAVYRVRSAWCFEVLGADCGADRARAFCASQGGCSECAYYKRVLGLQTSVLLITTDPALRASLESETHDSLAVHFARDGYEASSLVVTARPSFVVVDSRAHDMPVACLLDHLLNDSRAPWLRVILYGEVVPRLQYHASRVFAIVKAPLHLCDIAALIASVPVEHRQVAPDNRTDPENQ